MTTFTLLGGCQHHTSADTVAPSTVSTPKPSRFRKFLVLVVACVSLPVGTSIITPSTAAAASRCPAFVSWQDWFGGARVHAYVDFRASDVCAGQHVRRAYVTIVRECGPYFSTGRIYTSTATSTSNTALRSVSAWIFDSVLWKCVTRTYYGYEYFGSGGSGGGGGSGW